MTPANNQTLTWDVIDRLTAATGSYAAESISYDSSSNRKTYTGTSITRYANTDRMKKWGSFVVTYDLAGNMTGFSTKAMTYSQANRLATANPFGSASTYWYDAFGQRLKAKIPTLSYAVRIYDLSGHLLTETNSAVETDYAYLDDMPLSAIKPSAATISALHTDRIGMVQNATNAAKTTVWVCNFDPFGGGTPTTSITMNDRFPGMYAEFDGLLGLGRQGLLAGRVCGGLEADPLPLRARLFSNDYNYANQNPFKYIDPLGLWGIAFSNNSHSSYFNIGIGDPSYYVSPSSFAPSQINGPVSGLAIFMLGDGRPVPIGPDLQAVLQQLQKQTPWPQTTCSVNGYVGLRDYGSSSLLQDDYLVEFSLGHFTYTNNGTTTTVSDRYGFPTISNGTGVARFRNTLYSVILGTPYKDFGSWLTPK